MRVDVQRASACSPVGAGGPAYYHYVLPRQCASSAPLAGPSVMFLAVRPRAPHRARPTTLRRCPPRCSMVAAPEYRAAKTHTVGATHRVRGLQLTDHRFPLDHWATTRDGASITVFAREVVSSEKASTDCAALPWLVFLQGGPGFESPRPSEASGWLKTACESFRVLLLDQRGTGLSTRASASSLLRLGGVQTAADYLSHFRADSIVADCEALRLSLGVTSWSLLGQSFGGFCTLTYLSFAPGSVKEALITGGLAPHADDALTCPAACDDVYRRLLARVSTQTAKFYQRFPGDAATMRAIVTHLASQPGGGVALPSGGVLTPQGLQMLGWAFGGAAGFESVHYLLENAWDSDAVGTQLSLTFLRGFENTLPFDGNPLYALLHEACYANGGATEWSAQRVRSSLDEAHRELDPVAAAASGHPVAFTGEMVFPFIYDEIASLRPLKALAQALAECPWRASLYDVQQLRRNTTPVAACSYFEDMYVDFDCAQRTAGAIAGARQWVTNEYLHSGVREDGPRIFKALLALARNEEPVR